MIAAFREGSLKQARQLHHKLFPLCRDMLSLSTNPIPVKAAMAMLGRDCGSVRLPLTPLTDDQLNLLRATLQRYGMLPA